MQKRDRLRIWTEQGNVTISQLFFSYYKMIDVKDEEAILLLHLIAFGEAGNHFPTPLNLVERTHFDENKVVSILQRLVQKGFVQIEQQIDENGVRYEYYNFQYLWNLLLNCAEQEENSEEDQLLEVEEGTIYKLFEEEFGRLLSPMEYETIGMWFDQDQHTPSLIRLALKEAVLSQKLSLRYIDRILFEWKKKNIKTVEAAEKQTSNFRQQIPIQKQAEHNSNSTKVSFYNWLEERE
ncbi:DnaD domain-containing protein [Psychrobacillus vulpis]|uniref:DnaD domain-containing protein n=1 Tax=Psychrobacillus vulpis TaxID=2325572 RepID=A0A544TQR2_9BACI|nr:DnaD domain-containing protein [Psychrobacillus vulpis]TQR19745.1 DnaD domain-containing protein [Psychrobacillus vulpis]